MRWSRRGLERRSAITRSVNYLVMSLCGAVSLLSVSFFLLLRSVKSATTKFIESFCFANFAIFHVHLIQICFESKYSKKLCFLDSNTEWIKSIGFDIPLYAPLINIFNLLVPLRHFLQF